LISPIKTKLIGRSVKIEKKTFFVFLGEFDAIFSAGESMEFSGKAVAHLAADPNIMVKTGKIFMTGDLVSMS
jgi:hypothetical protein